MLRGLLTVFMHQVQALHVGYVVVGTWLAGAGCGEAQREYGSMVCTVGSI